jgi:hypothetical protein
LGPKEGGASFREDHGRSREFKGREGGKESVAIVGVDEKAKEVVGARA